MRTPLLAQAATDTCGVEPGAVCTYLLDRTGSETLAVLAGTVAPAALRIVVVLAVAFVATRLVRRFVDRSVSSVGERGVTKLTALRQRAPLADGTPVDLARVRLRMETIGGVLRSLATGAIWTLAVFTIMGALGINLGPLIAGAGIAGIALGFGAQNLVKDFLSGMFILAEDQYGIGDIVDVGEASGTVEAITLRTTRLRDVEGTVWYVPNGEIRRVGNKSQEWARVVIDVGVAYDTDIPYATAVIQRTADALSKDPDWREAVLEEPEVWGVQDFGPSEVVLRMVLKVSPAQQFRVNRELRARLKAAFDEAGIEMPFPQRTVWMRTAEPRNAEETEAKR